MIQPPYWFRMTMASHSFTVDVGIFSFLNGMFVQLKTKHQENQISLSYQILPLVLKLLLRPMLGELGFQETMTGKSGTNHKNDLQLELANLSVYLCCMPPSASIKVVSYRLHHLGGVDIPRPSATEQLDPFNDPVGMGMRDMRQMWT